uniref:Zinc finger C2H2 LYAR-type domain-containing protein n=1 Tax=Ditylenchus dipsaci TaxID=166011 RepID=A0A915D4H6_9BILA
MVYFTCDVCGDSLKKNQVQKHTFHCKSNTFSCIDCQSVFDKTTFKEHIKCITENQKYGGANYVAKENKGEVKQNSWIDQVNMAIENMKDQKLKKMLGQVANYTNIPRKEAKFINFLQNSVKIRDQNTCARAWKAISEAIKEMNEPQAQSAVEKEIPKLVVKEGDDVEEEVLPKVKSKKFTEEEQEELDRPKKKSKRSAVKDEEPVEPTNNSESVEECREI